MEMPELYGSAYVLPAIIVVVLLVALLAILLLRKKKGTGAVRTADGVTAKVAGAVTVSPPLGMTPKETPAADSSSDVPPNPPRQRQSVLDDAAVTRLAGLRDGSTSFADPLRAVIVDILQGWGELTAEDTKRLEVFRPDKVRAAVETVELPKEAKTGKYAQTRLAQLRHYAADLEVKTKKLEAEAAAVPPEPAPVTEPAMEPDAASLPYRPRPLRQPRSGPNPTPLGSSRKSTPSKRWHPRSRKQLQPRRRPRSRGSLRSNSRRSFLGRRLSSRRRHLNPTIRSLTPISWQPARGSPKTPCRVCT
jgi:hypothetical protein